MRFCRLIESFGPSYGMGLKYNLGKVYLAGSMLNNHKYVGDSVYQSIHHIPYLAKFDTSGTMDWIRFVGADNNNTFIGTAFLCMYAGLAIDGNNNIHRISYMRPGVELSSTYTTTQNGYYDIKYSSNGQLLSVTVLQNADTNFHIEQAEIDPTTNNLYVLFNLNAGSTTRSLYSLIAYGNNGIQLWKDSVGARSGIGSFRVVPGDGIYLSGSASSSTGHSFGIGGRSVSNTSYPIAGGLSAIAKLDFTGKAKWIRKVEGTSTIHSLYDLEILPNSNIVAVGTFAGKAKYHTDSIISTAGEVWNPLLIILDTAGKLIKLDQLHGSANEEAKVVTTDKVGNIYIGGQLETNISATGLTPYTTHGGNTDFFVMKYGRDCSCTSLPSAAFNFVVNAKNRSASFSFAGTSPADSVVWDFGDGSSSRQQNPMHVFPQHGNYTVCATVYTPCGSNKTCQAVSIPVSVQDIATFQNIRIYPNPTTAQLQIEGLSTHAAYEIYNTLGTGLQSGQLNPGRNTISTQTLPAGIYLLQVQSNSGEKQVYRINKQ